LVVSIVLELLIGIIEKNRERTNEMIIKIYFKAKIFNYLDII